MTTPNGRKKANRRRTSRILHSTHITSSAHHTQLTVQRRVVVCTIQFLPARPHAQSLPPSRRQSEPLPACRRHALIPRWQPAPRRSHMTQTKGTIYVPKNLLWCFLQYGTGFKVQYCIVKRFQYRIGLFACKGRLQILDLLGLLIDLDILQGPLWPSNAWPSYSDIANFAFNLVYTRA